MRSRPLLLASFNVRLRHLEATMRKRPRLHRRALVGGAVAALSAWSPAHGQLSDPSAASLGLGFASVAGARGFAALSANPAALGAPDAPAFTLAILPVRLGQGLEPVDLGDLARYGGKRVSGAVRESWLERVADAGSQVGSGSAQVALVAVSRGNLAAQVGVHAWADAALSPDAVELLLFGNAGRTGEPGDFVLAGSRMDGFALTTLTVGGGWPVSEWKGGTVSLGGSLALHVGNAVLLARDNGSSLTGDPIEYDVRFPVLEVSAGTGPFDAGRGVGVDVGALWSREGLGFGLTLRNLVNTFHWDVDHLAFRPGSALFDADDSVSDFDARPAAEAPPLLLDALSSVEFGPQAALGATYRLTPEVELAGNVTGRFQAGPAPDPRLFGGVGVEYVPGPRLRLQGGVAALTGAVQASGGLAVIFRDVRVGAALALRRGDGKNSTTAALTVSLRGG